MELLLVYNLLNTNNTCLNVLNTYTHTHICAFMYNRSTRRNKAFARSKHKSIIHLKTPHSLKDKKITK